MGNEDQASSLWLQTAPPIQADADLPDRADVIVAGAGLTGIATALMLAREGRRVAVVEARHVGAATTGHTTAKLSLLQGSVMGDLRERAGDRALRAYVAGNREAQDWIRNEARSDPLIIQRAPAYTYSTTPQGDALIDREFQAAKSAGLDVRRLDPAGLLDLGLPFPVRSALALPGQCQLHPMRLLAMLAQRLRNAGGRIVERCRVTGASLQEGGLHVRTERGDIHCSSLVLATGTPILDRGLFFAKLAPSRSFVAAYLVPEALQLPDGMFLSVDETSRSLRQASDGSGRPLLLVGSEGFAPGRKESTEEILSRLDRWTTGWFSGVRRATWWAAQDYRSVNRLPYAGPLPRGGGRIFAATGYNKWGMTNAVAAALSLVGEFSGEIPDWAVTLADARPVFKAGGEAVASNAEVAAELVSGWAEAEAVPRGEAPPPEGEGSAGRLGVRPVVEATVDGVSCRLSGVCTHLGGILRWNDAERTWDCPLHGSRFDNLGRVLEGPAVRDLTRL